MMTEALFRESLSNPYTWPGGYSFHYVMSDGEAMCHACGVKEADLIVEAIRDGAKYHSGWEVEAVDVYWEGLPIHCCHCNREIESEYGDPDAEDATEAAEESASA